MERPGLFQHTMRALMAPRRLIPILMIAIPLGAAQNKFSNNDSALPIAVAVVIAFVLIGPYAFRRLIPQAERITTNEGWSSFFRPMPFFRLLFFGMTGAIIPIIAWVIPCLVFGLQETFLASESVNLLVSMGLFWVGSFGLGSDIELEARLIAEKRRAQELTHAAGQAQLLAVRAHLDPHFLFNTLNAIAEWCREDALVAERGLLLLSGILREILAGVSNPTWPLTRDLELLKSLFELHRIRDPDRFDIVWEVDDDLPEVPIPPLVLLPLGENAMKHGPSSGNRGSVTLAVGLSKDAATIEIKIINPGPWGGPRSDGQGLETVQKRLDLTYRGRAKLDFLDLGNQTAVTLQLPATGPAPGVVA